MQTYTKPPMETLIDMVKKYDKRVGLRMLYQEYEIPESERYKYRKLWNTFYDLLPDAFEKDKKDASEIGQTKEDDGDSETQSFEVVPEEPWSPEDDEEPTQ